MKGVTLVAILISFAIGFAAIVVIICCGGIAFCIIRKVALADDEDEDFSSTKNKRKILPMLGLGT